MENKILVEMSARHVHVSEQDLATLFGEGYQLTNKKDLSQPGQFACEEKVEVVGPRGKMKMSILGPTRPETQVEVSLTDARTLGIQAPIRESGDLEGSTGCTIIGPEGSVELEKGVIVAKRHIHMTPADAEQFQVKDKEIVDMLVETEERPAIFKEVVVRVSEKYALAAHIDTDEANAIAMKGSAYGTICK